MLSTSRKLRSELPCRVADPELWFADQPHLLDRAKTLCADCPVRSACLSEALARREVCGVWGGEILDHGVVVGTKRARGRPRKNPVPDAAA